MSNKPLEKKPSSRRAFLKSSLASIASAPALLPRSAFSSSGELSLLMWPGTLPDGFIKTFSDQTGIKVKLSHAGSNEEMINKMKTSRGQGIDLLSPTSTRADQWLPLKLLQPLNFKKLSELSNILPALLSVGERDWNLEGHGSHWLPHVWGSEGIAWRTDMWQAQGAAPSYGDLWAESLHGKVMMRPHSGMLGVGLYLEALGQLPLDAMRHAYQDASSMHTTWAKVTAFCVANKSQIKLFWNDAETQRNALLNEGVVIGQAWDGPALALQSTGEPIQYQAAKEGALTWVDGFALSAKAANIPQAYAFLDFCFDAKNAGAAIAYHGYNSAVLGAEAYADTQYQQNFKSAYANDALEQLWVWPKEPLWYAKLRNDYRNRFINA